MKATMRDGLSLWLVGLVMIVLCAGCATSDGTKAQGQDPPAGTSLTTGPGQVTPAGEGTYYIHTIKWSRETVSIIAGWYTGDIQNWRALAEANPDIEVNKVHPGMKIRIPERLMTTKAPMTKEHVDSFYHKAKKRTGKMPAGQPKADEPKVPEPTLFGPKE